MGKACSWIQGLVVANLILFGFTPLQAGGPVIQPGEKVRLEFICRLESGELAATTDAGLNKQQGAVRSRIFRPRTSEEPLVVKAGREEATDTSLRYFEEEVVRRLGDEAVGLKSGEESKVALSTSPIKELAPSERFLQINSVRTRPKELRISLDTYRAQTKLQAEKGQIFTIDPAFPGKVVAVDDNQAIIEFAAQPGSIIETPFGKGTVRDAGKSWEVRIEAKIGDLVRNGPIVGRIASIEDRSITIDYGHPFGGEVLNCDVKATKLVEVEK